MFDITLTFDNGPEPDVTPKVLDILRDRDLKATFFVIGEKIADPERRALAVRAHEEGHWIGNHTYTHSVPLGLREEPDTAEEEIGRTQELIGDLVHPHRWFRPFGGGGNLNSDLLKPSVVEHLKQNRHSCVLWNSVPGDWRDPVGWVDVALEQCRAQPWSLLVIHDLPTGAMDNLETFLDRAEALGAKFRQDYPPECVPMCDGVVERPIDPFVSSIEERAQ